MTPTALASVLDAAGTAQPDRLRAALAQGAALVDERSLDDLLAWARRYARLVRFPSVDGALGGDWSAFLASDPTVLVAAVAQADGDAARAAVEAAGDALLAAPAAGRESAAAAFLDAAADLAVTLGGWRQRAEAGSGLRASLDRLAETSLGRAAGDLHALALAAEARGLAPLPRGLDQAAADLAATGRDAPEADPSVLPDDVAPDAITPADLGAFADRVRQSADALAAATGYLAAQAPALLEETLTTGRHEPHVALFLAFLLLFRHAQAHLNAFGERHLQWAYRDVLGLAPHAPEPEGVRVLFELARNAQPHLLPAGTLLRGDKGPDGVERLYATDDDLVVTAASVDRLMALRADAGVAPGLPKAPIRLVISSPPKQADGLPLPGDVVLTTDLPPDSVAIELQTGGITWPVWRKADRGQVDEYTARYGVPFLVAVTHETAPASGKPPGDSGGPGKPPPPWLTGGSDDADQIVAPGVDDVFEMGDIERWKNLIGGGKMEGWAGRLGLGAGVTVLGGHTPGAGGRSAWVGAAGPDDGPPGKPWPTDDGPPPKHPAGDKPLAGKDPDLPPDDVARPDGAAAEMAPDKTPAPDAEPVPLAKQMARMLGMSVQEAVALSPSASLVWVASARAADLRDALVAATTDPDDAPTGAPVLAVDLARGDIAWNRVRDVAAVAKALAPAVPVRSPGVWAAPVADSADGAGGEITRDDGSWAPFGDDATPAARLGFAIAADVLRLSEGTRRVRLGLRLQSLARATLADLDTARAELAANLTVRATTEKGWADLTVESVSITPAVGGTAAAITLELALADDAPPVVAYAEAVHALGVEAEGPVLSVLCVDGYAARARTASAGGLSLPFVPTLATTEPFVLGVDVPAGALRSFDGRVWVAANNRAGQTEPGVGDAWAEAAKAHPMRHLDTPRLLGVTVGVHVAGLRTLIAQGDGAGLNPAKTVAPFGMRPRRGSRVVVAHPELQKPLSSVRLSWSWEGLPEVPFETHYFEYDAPGVSVPRASDFVADAALLDGGAWRPLASGVRLFETTSSVPQPGWSRTFLIDTPTADTPAPFDALGPDVRSGALQLTLRQSFLHDLYPKRLAEIAIAASKFTFPVDSDGDGQYDEPEPVALPNAPYTPLAADLSVEYTAAAALLAGDDAPGLALFHLGPFGGAPIAIDEGAEREAGGTLVRHTLLPRFAVVPIDGPTRTLVGALYVGLTAADPPETASLLVQTAPGTADPEAVPPAVTWQVLEGDTWRSLRPDEVLADTTGGFVRSGIVRLALGRAVDAAHRLLPSGLRWLRAAVTASPDALDRLVAVRAQAVRATRVSGLAPPGVVEAGTVSKLKVRPPAVKGVEQPYASVGGRAAEGRDAFVRRVSERVGHRARAVTPADYERIALEAFPTLHRVRCVPHARVLTSGAVDEQAPGSVVVVVVPDVAQTAVRDPLRPRVSQGQLAEIRDTLAEAAADAVALDVRNPAYEPVLVRAEVQFRHGVDVGYGLRAVDAALVDALAPWHDAGGVRFGGRVERSHVLGLLEAHPLVDAVRDLRLTDAAGDEVPAAQASSPLAVLTSAPAHSLHEWTPEPCPTPSS